MIRPTEIASLAAEAGLAGAAVAVVRLGDAAGDAFVEEGPAIYPASMIKTPIAVAAAVAERDARLRWDDRVAVPAADMTVNDAPSPLQPGYRARVDELVELMVGRSDNVATNVLIDLLGRERASADLAALGFARTAVRRKLSGALPLIDDPAATGRNEHALRDAATLFTAVARGDVPGAERLRRILAGQYWNGKLSAGLEPGDAFAHKTGDTDEVSHDGGILELSSGERYVLVVYTTLPSNDANDRRFGTFMRALRPHLTAQSR